MTFATGGKTQGRAHSWPMEVILTIIWLASVSCVFVLIGIIGSHAERAPAERIRTDCSLSPLVKFKQLLLIERYKKGSVAKRLRPYCNCVTRALQQPL